MEGGLHLPSQRPGGGWGPEAGQGTQGRCSSRCLEPAGPEPLRALLLCDMACPHRDATAQTLCSAPTRIRRHPPPSSSPDTQQPRPLSCKRYQGPLMSFRSGPLLCPYLLEGGGGLPLPQGAETLPRLRSVQITRAAQRHLSPGPWRSASAPGAG